MDSSSSISKKNNRFFKVFSLRRNIFSIVFLLFIVSLVLFSSSNMLAVKNGLKLWANNVVPALFPFFIAVELLSYTNVSKKVSKLFTPLMRPIFNVPGFAAYAFILGLISGYPVGAKIVSKFMDSGICSKDECERMLAFTNNSGPLFIIGTVGVTLFRSSSVGFLLLITHILSSIVVGILFGIFSRFQHFKDSSFNSLSLNGSSASSFSDKKVCSFSNLGEVIGSSIVSAIKTVLTIGGFVVLFSVVISILNKSNVLTIVTYIFYPVCKVFNFNFGFVNSILTGIVELTNGVSLVSGIADKCISNNIIICAFLLGLGGLSVLLQVFSIVSKSGLSIKKYVIGKFLQGIIAAFLTYIFINTFSIFNFNL